MDRENAKIQSRPKFYMDILGDLWASATVNSPENQKINFPLLAALFGVLLLVLLLLFSYAHAEDTVWNNPGEAPFEGTPTEAALALANCGAPYAPVAQLAYRAQFGGCEEGEVEDGDRFDLMLFKHGCLRNVVARIDGSPGWIGKSRRKLVCHDQWGHYFIIPAACNNGAYNYLPPAVPPPPEALWISGYPGAWSTASPGWMGGFISGPAGFLGVSGNGVTGGDLVARAYGAAGRPAEEMPPGPSSPRRTESSGAPGWIAAGGPAENIETVPQPVSEPWSMPMLVLAVVIVIALRWRLS